MGDYKEDVIAEILARLPVRDLMRFRCVCKSWRALISESYFVKKHLNYQERGITESPRRLIFMMDPPSELDCEALKTTEDYDDNPGQLTFTPLYFPVIEANRKSYWRDLYGACNGLVCVEDEMEGIMLWNPCTRECKILPSPPQVDMFKFSPYLYGLGYDSANDDYKVIWGFGGWSDGAKEVMIQIFSLKTGLWRTVTGCDYYVDLGREWMGLFVNGALHWFYTLSEGGSRILSFDLGKEEFQKTVPLPYDGFFSDLLIHRNCLCVCSCPTGTNSINIWMMKEYGVKESWTQVVQFSLEGIKLPLPRHWEEFIEPVCILENGLLLSIAMCYSVRLVVFANLKEKTFTHSAHVVEDEDTLIKTVMYRETLVSPGIHTYRTNCELASSSVL